MVRDRTPQEVADALRDGAPESAKILVVVDQFAPAPGVAPPSYMYWAFLASMANPEFTLSTLEQAQELLERESFRFMSATGLSPSETRRWSRDWTIVQASRE